MRSAHAPMACITGEDNHHAWSVPLVPKERIMQKSPLCLVDKRDFFVGTPEGTRLHFLSPLRKKIDVRHRRAVGGNSPPDCCI